MVSRDHIKCLGPNLGSSDPAGKYFLKVFVKEINEMYLLFLWTLKSQKIIILGIINSNLHQKMLF